jgi:hypothetical protein
MRRAWPYAWPARASSSPAPSPSANVQIDLDDDDDDAQVGRVVLPSDPRVRIDLDDDDDDDADEFEPVPESRQAPRSSPATGPKLLRTLPFLDDDEDVFSIDTDARSSSPRPLRRPPTPDRPGFDQKFAEHSNSRIVIEVLDDDAWPEEEDIEVADVVDEAEKS